MSQILKRESGSLIEAIHGEIAQPPMSKLFLSYVLYLVFLLGFIFTFSMSFLIGFLPNNFPFMNELQSIAQWLKDHQAILIICFFVCNLMSSSLIQTGAFEVLYDGELIWSKLETGKLPTPEYLIQQLKQFAQK